MTIILVGGISGCIYNTKRITPNHCDPLNPLLLPCPSVGIIHTLVACRSDWTIFVQLLHSVLYLT